MASKPDFTDEELSFIYQFVKKEQDWIPSIPNSIKRKIEIYESSKGWNDNGK